MNAIVLPKSIAQQIESEGVTAYPNECCGILIGKERCVVFLILQWRILNHFDDVETTQKMVGLVWWTMTQVSLSTERKRIFVHYEL